MSPIWRSRRVSSLALLLLLLVLVASPSIAASSSLDGFVSVYRGSCATASALDAHVVSSRIPANALCNNGRFSFGLRAEHDFAMKCGGGGTGGVGRVELHAHGSQCTGGGAGALATQCADGIEQASGLYHVFSCDAEAATLKPTSTPAPTVATTTLKPTSPPSIASTTPKPTSAPSTSAPSIAVSTTSASSTSAPSAAAVVNTTPAPSSSSPTTATTTTTTTRSPSSNSELDLAEDDEEDGDGGDDGDYGNGDDYSEETPAPAASPTVTNSVCATKNGVNKEQCAAKIKKCANQYGIKMKWTGPGCTIASSGIRYFDGGCQCDGYCGYNCRSKCNLDSQCTWSSAAKVCLVKKTGTVGVGIRYCQK